MSDLSQGARDPLQDAIRDLKLVKEWRCHAISSAAEKDRRIAELKTDLDDLRAGVLLIADACKAARTQEREAIVALLHRESSFASPKLIYERAIAAIERREETDR